MKRFALLMLAAVTPFCGSAAWAQQAHRVASSKIETGPWTLTPIYAEESNGVPHVVSFLALADASAAMGENLVAVWYKREATGWATKS